MELDYGKIRELAKKYEPDMTRFLRDMIAIPSESCQEEKLIQRIKQEMEKVGFDEVVIDPMGNILGYMGTGERLIAFDAHIDTVGIGNRDNWTFDPYEGFEDAERIGGRGASDQEGGMASMVYAAKIMKDLGLLEGLRVVMVGTVQEEDCDGLCWQYIVKEDKVRPEFVVSTEPTDGRIHRGQRGRMEIMVKTKGVSCHGSAPERGTTPSTRWPPSSRSSGPFTPTSRMTRSWARAPWRCRRSSSPARPVRRGGQLLDLHRPASHRWGNQGAGPSADKEPALGGLLRGGGFPVHLRAALLHGAGVPHRVLLPLLGA